MHWAIPYVGKKWVAGGRGPEVFDCWGLCWWVEKEHFQRNMPLYALDPHDHKLCAQAFHEAQQSQQWVEIKQPVEGCIVGLGRGSFVLHCGVWTAADGGLVLHAQEKSNVVAHSLARLRADGWQRITFHQHISWQQ